MKHLSLLLLFSAGCSGSSFAQFPDDAAPDASGDAILGDSSGDERLGQPPTDAAPDVPDAAPDAVTTDATDAAPTCGTNDVSYQGHCYYLDGSDGICDPGYALASDGVLAVISPLFAGLTYKHTVSSFCCIMTTSPGAVFGVTPLSACNGVGSWTSMTIQPNVPPCGPSETMRYAGQLTFCGTP